MSPQIPPGVRMVLASSSPRRRKMLEDAGFHYDCYDPGDAEEAVLSRATPEELAIAKAVAKARAVAEDLDGPYPAVVIGADTVVALGNEVIGKPLDRMDARSILQRLSGSTHRVISGVCLWPLAGPPAEHLHAQAPVTWATSTGVVMKAMPPREIEAYVCSGESDGKAGAYAIQENGDRFVERLEGSLPNVVGFPLEEFLQRYPEVLRAWNFV